MKHSFGKTLALTLFSASFLAAQSVDDTQLKQIIIFGRHNVRSPTATAAQLLPLATQTYPDFGVGPLPGILTANGEKLETILGGYYRLWLTQEGLLTGNDAADANFVYAHANVIQRTVDTAQHFWSGFLPGAPVNVSYLTPDTVADPLFEPSGAGVSTLDPQLAVAAVMGRLGPDAQTLSASYAPEFALSRSVLLNYPLGTTPAPAAPSTVTDVVNLPISLSVGDAYSTVNLGGLSWVAGAVDPFIMEYADGMAPAQVAWGKLNEVGVSQTLRILTLVLDLQLRTPYIAGVESSNVASHIVRSMVQFTTGNAMTGALAVPSTKVILLIASDDNVCGLAGLLHLDWLVPTYQKNFCAPGGALSFQLRQSQSTGEYIVRAAYIAQTLDQLRNLTPLTLDAPPAIAPVFIPGCSIENATFDCPLTQFVHVASQVIDPHSVDLMDSHINPVSSGGQRANFGMPPSKRKVE